MKIGGETGLGLTEASGDVIWPIVAFCVSRTFWTLFFPAFFGGREGIWCVLVFLGLVVVVSTLLLYQRRLVALCDHVSFFGQRCNRYKASADAKKVPCFSFFPGNRDKTFFSRSTAAFCIVFPRRCFC